MAHGPSTSNALFSLTGYNLAKLVLSQPIGACLVCVILSLMYDFKEATATHCRVKNYLPSISAAIGGFTPQRYIWRICIALHTAPRFMIALMFFNYFQSFRSKLRWKKSFTFLAATNCIMNVVENLFLLLLTYVSSTENHKVHENSFIGFLVCSEVCMLLTLVLFYWSRGRKHWSSQERKSFRYKLTLFVANLAFCAGAAYFFYRHNAYCEPGVYTVFAAFEYLVVGTNIAFHATAAIDFGAGTLSFNVPSVSDHFE